MSIETDIASFAENTLALNQVVEGDSSTTVTTPEGNSIKSVAKTLADAAGRVGHISRTVANMTELEALDISVEGETDGSTVRVLGYYAEGDGGGGLFELITSSDTATAILRAVYGESGKRWRRVCGTVLNARWFGTKGDGTTDDSTTIQALMTAVRTGVHDAASGGDRLSGFTAYFPAGEYIITESESLCPSTYTTKSRGARVIGDGMGQTVLWFKPTTGTRILWNNNKSFLFSEMRDLSFKSDDNQNTFFKGTVGAEGATQRWSFDRCEWHGNWGYGFHFIGTNLNSEFCFNDCGVHGEMTKFLYTPSSGAVDQHLNYWFDNMKFNVTAASPADNCMIELNKGGSVKIVNSDFSGLTSGTLFRLLGSSHAYGVCSFLCSGCRFELKNDNQKVLRSQWDQGFITFRDCDFGSQTSVQTETVENFTFADSNVGGAMVLFEQCVIIGTTVFTHNTSDYLTAKRHKYVQCSWPQFKDIFEAFTFTSSTNNAGHRPVEFDGCRGETTLFTLRTAWAGSTAYSVDDVRRNGKGIYICTGAGTSASSGGPTGKGSSISDGTATWDYIGNAQANYRNDCVYSWRSRSSASGVKRRIANFAGPVGGLEPGPSTIEIVLPPHAIIVAARIYAASGATGSGGAANVNIKTNEPSPTTFATGTDSPASAGFDYTWSGFFPVGNDIEKRCLTLTVDASLDQYVNNCPAFVEYIA